MKNILITATPFSPNLFFFNGHTISVAHLQLEKNKEIHKVAKCISIYLKIQAGRFSLLNRNKNIQYITPDIKYN